MPDSARRIQTEWSEGGGGGAQRQKGQFSPSTFKALFSGSGISGIVFLMEYLLH